MQRYSLPDPRFLPLGRHDPKETQAHLWWSGSGVRLKTACTRLDIEVTSTCTDHAAYLNRIGEEHLSGLKIDPAAGYVPGLKRK